MRWHYQTEPCRSAYSFLNLFRRPDFVLLDHDEKEVLRIRRRTRFPPRSDILQNGEVVGTIRLRSVLLNRYSLVLKAGPTWTFRMPLFTIRFYGESSANSRVRVLMGPKVQWMLHLSAGADDVRLVAGLAFIHRQWWCYS